eukprot:2393330-Pleurochrysis_carterae.AAC.1
MPVNSVCAQSAVNDLALGALSELRALLVAATGPVWDIIPDCDECHAPGMGHIQALPFNDFTSSSTDRISIVRSPSPQRSTRVERNVRFVSGAARANKVLPVRCLFFFTRTRLPLNLAYCSRSSSCCVPN